MAVPSSIKLIADRHSPGMSDRVGWPLPGVHTYIDGNNAVTIILKINGYGCLQTLLIRLRLKTDI